MSDSWYRTSRNQRMLLAGVVVVLSVLCLQVFLWSPLQESAMRLENEITTLRSSYQVKAKQLEELNDLETKIQTVRKRISPDRVRQVKEVQSFRQDIARVAQESHVVFRLWEEKFRKPVGSSEEKGISIDLRIEGDFPQTLEFFDRLSGLDWVKRIDSVVITPKAHQENTGIVSVEMNLNGVSPEFLQSRDLQLAT